MKKVLLGLLLALLLISTIVIIKTLNFNSKQLAVQPVEAVAVGDAVLTRLSEAIQIPTNSWTPTRIDTAAFQNWIAFVERSYPLVHEWLNKTLVNDFSLVYHWEGSDESLKPILLIGHIDVVPVEEESRAAWTEDPYSGLVKDGYIWGRGSMDDKMTITALLETVEMLLQTGYSPKRSVYFGFGHDEEVLGRYGAGSISQMFEQLNMEFEYVLDEGGISLNGIMPGSDKPVSLIGIAEKGILNLSLKAELEEGGHSAMPPQETAIRVLSDAILKLTDNPFSSKMDDQLTTLTYDYMGREMSGVLKMFFANRWLFDPLLERQISSNPTTNASIRTTIAPTILQSGVKENVLPTTATATVNFRIMPGETTESVMEYVKNTIADERVQVINDMLDTAANPSPISPTDALGFELIQQTIGEIMPPSVVVPSLCIAATDSRFYYNVSDNVYRYTPMLLERTDLSRIHGIDERLSVENYKRMIAFYHRLILNSCGE